MDTYRILQVGCGGISDAWLNTLTKKNNVEIAGLVDFNEKSAAEKKEKYGLSCPIFTDLKEALRLLSPDIVIDNTIPESHNEVVIAALESGAHVFGEKPISDTFEKALKMVEKSDETKREYFIMQNRRYITNIRQFADIVKSDKIGTLGYLSSDFYRGPHFGGFREKMKSPLILDMAIHTFDQARFISSQDPVSVYCHEFNPVGSWYEGNASAVCIFEMTNNLIFSYAGSWCARGGETSWESQWRAMGSNGYASWDGSGTPLLENGQKENEPLKTWDHLEGHAGCIDEMFAAIEEGRAAETDCRDNIKSFAMVMAAVKSSEEKRKVNINELY